LTTTVLQTSYATATSVSTESITSVSTVSDAVTSVLTSYFTLTTIATISQDVATVNIGTTDVLTETDIITKLITLTPSPVSQTFVRRDNRHHSVPSCFSGPASSALSSACSCFLSTTLSPITVYTTTKTVHQTATSTIPKTTTYTVEVGGFTTTYISEVITVTETETLASDITSATVTQISTLSETLTVDIDTTTTQTLIITETVVTIASSTTTTTTSSVCTPAPTVFNGDFETGSLSPWTYTQTSDSGATDSSVSVSSTLNNPDEASGFDSATIILGTDQDNSVSMTTTVHNLCGAGTKFRVNFDYYCQAEDFDTSVSAYLDGNELYASSCNFPGSWQTDNLLYSTSVAATAQLTIVISWQSAGNSFAGTGFTWQLDNVYGINGFS